MTITEIAQYLTLILDNELFALEISKVREVIEFHKVTKVPQTPEFMRGVINRRGNVVPVLDLNLKFGAARTETTIDTCIVIIEVEIDGEKTILGAIADSVQEVIELEPNQIGPPPRMGTRLRTDFIKGMGYRNEEFIIILDIDQIFSSNELCLFKLDA